MILKKENKENKENIPLFRLDQDWPLDTIVPITTDPLGSYTGFPADITEAPVQDADDL